MVFNIILAKLQVGYPHGFLHFWTAHNSCWDGNNMYLEYLVGAFSNKYLDSTNAETPWGLSQYVQWLITNACWKNATKWDRCAPFSGTPKR
jgi:hypothetical protein